MKVNRHGKPSKVYTSTLRDAGMSDYLRLVNAALEAVITGEEDVLIAFAYVLKYPANFPKGVLVEKVDDKNIRRVKAKKLLAWLNARGYTDITTDSLRGAIISSGLRFVAFDEMCEFKEIEEETWQKLSVSTAGQAVARTPSQTT